MCIEWTCVLTIEDPMSGPYVEEGCQPLIKVVLLLWVNYTSLCYL